MAPYKEHCNMMMARTEREGILEDLCDWQQESWKLVVTYDFLSTQSSDRKLDDVEKMTRCNMFMYYLWLFITHI
jgi:hypothetical protein